MTNYKVTDLNDKTPVAEQTKLEMALKAVAGVEKVALHPEKSEVSLSFGSHAEPKRAIIEKAIESSGFGVAAQR